MAIGEVEPLVCQFLRACRKFPSPKRKTKIKANPDLGNSGKEALAVEQGLLLESICGRCLSLAQGNGAKEERSEKDKGSRPVTSCVPTPWGPVGGLKTA